MTITVVCDVFGAENNGTAVVTMNLIRHLQGCGHTVRILCADQEKRGEAGYYVVPQMDFGKLLNRYVAHVGVTLARPDEATIARALCGADHVHVMLPLGLGMAAARMAHEMGIPLTAGFHMQAENLTSHLKLNKVRPVNTLVYQYIYRHLYRYADGIHYPTQFIRETFESRIGRETPGYVISNGVHSYVGRRNVTRPQEYADKIVILTTGRYSAEKSQETLLRAVSHSKYKDKIQLILAGQGPKQRHFEHLAKRLPVPPLFKLFPRDELIDTLNWCDLYVHPAVDELEGIACLESIACGKLTIVSDSRNSATKGFAVDGKCVFRHKRARDLARVIDYWIEHPQERARYEEKYAESAVVYRQEACMQEMSRMICKVQETCRARAAARALPLPHGGTMGGEHEQERVALQRS